MAPNIAVVGGGYWGKNLIRNFNELGALCTVCDGDPLVEMNVRQKYPQAEYYADYTDVLKDDRIAGVVLATPAVLTSRWPNRPSLPGKTFLSRSPWR